MRETRGRDTPYVNCLVRKREMRLTPEEAVRQLYVMMLIKDFEYPIYRMELEYGVSFGRQKKRADIVILKEKQFVPICNRPAPFNKIFDFDAMYYSTG